MKKSKIIQKTVKLFLAFVMFLGVLFQNSSLTSAQGTEVDRVNTKITRFEIKNHDGTPAPGYHYWNEYRLDMDWDASSYGNQLKQGDYFIVKLPEQFKFPTDGPTVDFKLYAPDGKTVIANAHVNSNGEQGGGTVKVTFTKYVENRENVKGNLYLQAGFAHSKINEGGDNIIDIQIGSVKKSTNIKIGPKPTIKNETFAKWGATVPGNDNQAKWVLRINHIKGNYSNLTISDRLYVDEGNLPPTIHYIRDSFVLYELEYDQYGYTSRVVNVYKYNDLKDFIKFSGNDTQFTFEYSKKFGDINGRQYRLTYNTTYIPQLKLKNEGIFKSTETNIIYRAWFNNAEAGGTGQGDLIQKIKIFKVDENDRQIKLPNAEFLITKVKDGSTFTLKTDAQGEAVSEKLEPGKYKIKETKAPDGYILDPTEKEVNVVEGEVLFWTATNAKITNIDIAGKKTWDDKNNQDGKRPDKIKVILNKTVDGKTTKVEEKEVKADTDGNWKYEFNNLPKHENGKLITYSIDEEDVPGYEKSTDGYNLKNKYTPEKVSIAGKKSWDDGNNQDGKRPDKIKVILNKTVDGQTTKVTEKEVTKDNWNYEFNDLPKYENGKEITYSIDEEAVPGYEKSTDGYNLKNKYTPEKVSIAGKKTWDDSNNQDGKRPDKIKVILNKTVDGQTTKVTEKEVTKENNWSYEFNDLPKYENGKEITYSIDEEAVPGYEKSTDGYNLKNKYTLEKVSIAGKKTWDDGNNQDGKRPDKIKVILNKTVDGQTTKVTEKEVTKDNWNYEFNDLPKYENGKEITYSIDEEAVPGYGKEVTGHNLKNTHTPEKVSVAGTKTWDDSNNQDGKRPDKIKVILNKTVDGQTTKVTEKEVTKDNWNYEFNDLPKYENGKEITYSIDEEAVPGYEKEVTGYNLKNSHTPEVVNVQGTKTWDDANNKDGKRPDKIKVILNKTVDGQTTKVTEKEVTKDNWNYEFNDLPKYENGKEITYSIDEEAVPGYEKSTDGYNLKNKYTPEKVSIAGKKTWDDSNNQDGKRPDKIKVILNKTVDGQTTKVTEKEVTKDNWNYEFNDLPKYENGKEITYSIDEEAVPGYEKEVTGYNLKNSHTPEVVNVQGTKTWDDANNQDGKRPDKIKVILNKTVDGQTTKVTEKEVTKDNWNYEFNDLPKYENGKEITYSIDEEAVPGYEKEVTGYNLKNSHTPEVVNVQGTKTWDDANNQDGKRPDKIKVILNKTVDGQTTKVTEKEVTKDNWNYEFNDLPKYENGKEITYSIDEEAVPGYEKSTDGYNLKNKYTPEKVSIAGKKTWDDSNNQDGKRPDKIKVILNKTVDGQTTKVTEKEVTKDNWNYEFNDLPKYENGKEITYSIDEEAVPGYEKEVTGYNLKNSHTPEVVNVQGTKTWDDANNKDGKRPDKIKVILNKTVDGQTTKVTEKEVTKDNWNYEFNDLPKYENGKEITYSIDEEAVPGYEKEVTGYNLKNSHTPEVVNVQGTKTWDDANNQDGKRPDKIKVILNKTVDGQTTKVTEKEVTKDNWNYEFNDLPKYENGKEITYSIDEEAVEGYKKSVDGYNLTNKYIPPKPKLPKTGSTTNTFGGLGILGLLTGLVLNRRKNKAN